MAYSEVMSYYAHRSSDWTFMCGATLDIEVDTVWCFALDLKRGSGCVVEVLVQQLKLMLAIRDSCIQRRYADIIGRFRDIREGDWDGHLDRM